MNFRALEKSESWKSPGNLFLKKGTSPVICTCILGAPGSVRIFTCNLVDYGVMSINQLYSTNSLSSFIQKCQFHFGLTYVCMWVGFSALQSLVLNIEYGLGLFYIGQDFSCFMG